MSVEFCLELCDHCGSEGRIYAYIAPNPSMGRFDPDCEDLGECPACKGTGLAYVECEPVTLEDLQ